MKKRNNLNSTLFKKFEREQVSNLSSIIGGYEPPTDQSSDVSNGGADITMGGSDVTTWEIDSTTMNDSSRELD
ncbi:hypothetical protein [Zhouia amylolytica]|nr:hypothetical protein [Zhouia amylolytica]